MAFVWEDGEQMRGPGCRKQYHYPRRETEEGQIPKEGSKKEEEQTPNFG